MENTETLVMPNFDQVQDAIAPGIYQARIIDSKIDKWVGKDGKPDTAIIVWTLETFNEADEDNNGRKIFHRTPIEGPGAFRLKDFYLAAVGVECTGSFDPTWLYSAEVELTMAQQKKNPEYLEVKAVRGIKH